MVYDKKEIEINDDATIYDVIQKLKERCDGDPHEWGLTTYKNEIYGICSTDCADCGVRELIKLLTAIDHKFGTESGGHEYGKTV